MMYTVCYYLYQQYINVQMDIQYWQQIHAFLIES